MLSKLGGRDKTGGRLSNTKKCVTKNRRKVLRKKEVGSCICFYKIRRVDYCNNIKKIMSKTVI